MTLRAVTSKDVKVFQRMFHKNFEVILMKLFSEQCGHHMMVTKLNGTSVYIGAFTHMFSFKLILMMIIQVNNLGPETDSKFPVQGRNHQNQSFSFYYTILPLKRFILLF